jgi:hypothetical protein
MERDSGIEPLTSTWKDEVIPFYESRMSIFYNEDFLKSTPYRNFLSVLESAVTLALPGGLRHSAG